MAVREMGITSKTQIEVKTSLLGLSGVFIFFLKKLPLLSIAGCFVQAQSITSLYFPYHTPFVLIPESFPPFSPPPNPPLPFYYYYPTPALDVPFTFSFFFFLHRLYTTPLDFRQDRQSIFPPDIYSLARQLTSEYISLP